MKWRISVQSRRRKWYRFPVSERDFSSLVCCMRGVAVQSGACRDFLRLGSVLSRTRAAGEPCRQGGRPGARRHGYHASRLSGRSSRRGRCVSGTFVYRKCGQDAAVVYDERWEREAFSGKCFKCANRWRRQARGVLSSRLKRAQPAAISHGTPLPFPLGPPLCSARVPGS
jgi:hypothetical protein